MAAWYESSWGGEEGDVVEVIAAHYLEAYNLAPQDPDADQVRDRAADVLFQAGERAASLAANTEAERYFEQAARLVPAGARQAEMHERAGQMAARAGRYAVATRTWNERSRCTKSENLPHPAARALSRLGLLEAVSGQLDHQCSVWSERSRFSPTTRRMRISPRSRRGSVRSFFKGDTDIRTANRDCARYRREARLPRDPLQAL